MAPKDEHASKNIPQGLNHESQESSFDESSNSSTCATDNEKQDRGWKRRLLLQIKTLMWGVKGGGNSESLASQFISKYGSRAILGIAVVFIYKLASPRIKRRLWPFLLAMSQNQEYHKAVQVSLSLLRSAALNGSVTRALVGSDEIMFQERLTKQWKRSKLPSNSPNLQSDLVELLARNGCDNVSTLPETFWSRASPVLLTALPFVYLAMVYKIFKNMHNDGGNSASRLLNNASQTTRFTDIAGLDPIIAEVQDIVSYLRNPSSYLQVGAHPPRGILLHGLPGSGKTLLAQALAGEGNCDTFITCSGSDFCEMYVGRGT